MSHSIGKIIHKHVWKFLFFWFRFVSFCCCCSATAASLYLSFCWFYIFWDEIEKFQTYFLSVSDMNVLCNNDLHKKSWFWNMTCNLFFKEILNRWWCGWFFLHSFYSFFMKKGFSNIFYYYFIGWKIFLLVSLVARPLLLPFYSYIQNEMWIILRFSWLW